jgi:hypothetical protein
MSIVPSPNVSAIIAEHSMCQPGRPSHIALSRCGESARHAHAGSPSRRNFHSAKSSGSSFSSFSSIRAPINSSSMFFPDSCPYRGKDATRK